jgi:hypothetical protein
MYRSLAAFAVAALLAGGAFRGLRADEAPGPAAAPAPVPDGEVADDDAAEPGRVLVVDVPKVETVTENYVGVVTAPVPEVVRAQLAERLGEAEGLLVKRVLAESPAEKCGLLRNDNLVTFDDQKLESSEQLKKLVSEAPGDAEVRLGVLRGGKLTETKATLAQRTVSQTSVVRRLRIRSDDGARVDFSGLALDAEAVALDDGRVSVSVVKRDDETDDEEADHAEDGPAVRRFSLRELEDGRVQLDVRYTDRNGEVKDRTLVGTRRELRRQLRELPPDVRAAARQLLYEPRPDRGFGPMRFRLNLQPSLRRSGEGSLQIQIVRPGKDGETKVFNLEGFLAPKEEGGVRGNLDIEVLKEELGELEPKVRVQVQDALERIRVPAVKVEVETSQ